METGVAPAVEVIQGLSEDKKQRELEKEELALSCNLDRRQLDKEDASQVFEARLDNLLDKRRTDKKLTQEKVAAVLGVSKSTVSLREQMRHNSEGGTMSKPDARRKYDDELKREAVRLVKAGMPKPELARQLLMTLKAVERAVKEAEEREAGGVPAEGGKGKKAAASKPPQPIEDITATGGVPDLHRRANEHLKRDDHAYIEQLKASAAQARKDVEAVSDIHKLQELSLSYGLILAFVDLRLRKILPGDSKPNTAGIEPAPILLGSVMAYEQEEVFVELSSGGGGVIDNRSDFLAMYGRPKADEVVRVRVEGFDWKRGLWKLQPQARQTVAPAPGAIAGSHRDDSFSSDTKLAGRKAGPKNKEVTK
jgi:transcriptional regulator with XRE-family HTH domain